MYIPSITLSYLVAEALLFPWTTTATPIDGPAQWTLIGEDPVRQQTSPHRQFIEQNGTICDAGSRQWTGLVPVDAERDLFFWYFESRHQPEDAPIIIWLNGGPGASSLLGAFHEIGPCTVDENGKETIRNNNSWTEFANMLFIDQPVGVGFSDPQQQTLWARNLQESAIDLDKFLDAFFQDYFPELKGRPLHLAGESFGGKYCPVYADLMRRRFDSVILVNAYVDPSDAILGLYEHFCASEFTGARRGLNASACEEMEQAFDKCQLVGAPYQRQVVPGGQNPYDDRTDCIDPPMCGRLGMQEVATYLNQPEVQEALGFEERLFEPVNMRFNSIWAQQADIWLPSSREISRILDQKSTPVLVLNGNDDAIVNTEGILRTYNSMLWSGHAAFQSGKLKPWYHGEPGEKRMALGGRAKVVKNLAVVTIDDAGHMSPHDQPLAVSRVVQTWLGQDSVSESVVGLFE